jgi:hypothetical protein
VNPAPPIGEATTTTTGYPAAVKLLGPRPRPKPEGTMVVCGLACPSPQNNMYQSESDIGRYDSEDEKMMLPYTYSVVNG